MNTSLRFILLITGFIFILLVGVFNPCAIAGISYYVDYASGSDSNDGKASSNPFKHCPGDANATGVAVSTILAPGDTINFKGGVKYRGQINISKSGSPGSPITYKGDPGGWGSGKAVLVGSEPLVQAWTKCVSAADCWQNPNWANIWYTTIPPGATFINRLYQNSMYVNISQAPKFMI